MELSVRFIRGLGPKKGEAFEKSGIITLRDLLYFIPRRYIDRTRTTPISSIKGQTETEVTLIGTITDAREVRGKKGRGRYEVYLEDETDGIALVWFKKTNQIKKWIKPGFTAAFSGKVNRYGDTLQIAHPDVTYLSKGEAEDLIAGKGRWVAIYPGNKEFERVSLDNRGMRTLMDRIIGEFVPMLNDHWTESYLKKYGIVSLQEAMYGLHRPRNQDDFEKGIERIKFDELLMLQLLWAWARRKRKEKSKGISYPAVKQTTRDLINKKLPFKLTDSQRSVLHEIWDDMKSPYPMSRMLQGDVGSGKTVVALIAMSIAVENGYQAALMVPTEILAEQHYLTSRRFLEGLGIKVNLLTGSIRAKAKKDIQEGLESGEPCIIIGTHALIQKAVTMPNLGLVVIDEQHRFGVAQRLKLMNPETESKPDVLIMTATPIPRSLAISLYGDLEVSRIDEMPPGRGKITTKVINGDTNRETVYNEVRKRVNKGGKAYIVFPLIAESEKIDLQAAIEGRELLMSGFLRGIKLGLLHGKMKIDEKEEAMRKFKDGSTPVLVSTTVIEVGIDIPEATEMVIEHAERFGLAQLHQLRGRIGRGGRDSRCYLIGYPPVSEVARARLKIMSKSNDGFNIAEEDLRIRGGGDFFGIRQHGMPELRFSDIIMDQGLLLKARRAADDLISVDPDLKHIPELKKEFERSALSRLKWMEVG